MLDLSEKVVRDRNAIVSSLSGFSSYLAVNNVKLLYGLSVVSFCSFIYGGILQNNLVKNAALAAGLPATTYLCAKVPTKEEKESAITQKLIELQAEIIKLEGEKEWFSSLNSGEVLRWQSECKEVKQQLEETIASHASQIEALECQYASEIDSLKTSHQATLRASLAAKDREIERLTQQHDQVIATINSQVDQLLSQIEQVKADADAKVTAAQTQARENHQMRSRLEKQAEEIALAEKSLRLEEKRIRLDVRDERGITKKALEDAQLELKALNAINQRLSLELSELKAQNAQLFDELYGSESQLKDELVTQIQSCLGQNQIPTEFISKEVRGGVDFIYLKPTAYFEPSRLKVVADLLPGFVDIPKPDIDAKNGRIEIKIDNRSAIDKIKDVSPNWLGKLYQDAAIDGKNFAILGARGGGKTELAKNLCGLILNSEPDCEIVYIQPKIDDYAVFELGGKQFEPEYIGFEPITGSAGNRIPSAYEGIFYLKELYNRRNTQNQQAFADGQPSPKFNRVFFLIDELQLLVSREKEFIDPDIIKEEGLRNGQTFCGKIVRDAISIGRSLGIVVLALGQIPNVSVYGWQKQDLYQFIVLFMAASIPEAIKSAAPTKQEEKRISEDLELWRKRAEINSTKRFYCYVRPMDKSGYLALLPEPGKYLESQRSRQAVARLVDASSDKDCGDLSAGESPISRTTSRGYTEQEFEATEAEESQISRTTPQDAPILARSDSHDSNESTEILKRIEQIKATGEVRLKNIIAYGFQEKYPKCSDQHSSDYRKARAEYKRLTGQ